MSAPRNGTRSLSAKHPMTHDGTAHMSLYQRQDMERAAFPQTDALQKMKLLEDFELEIRMSHTALLGEVSVCCVGRAGVR